MVLPPTQAPSCEPAPSAAMPQRPPHDVEYRYIPVSLGGPFASEVVDPPANNSPNNSETIRREPPQTIREPEQNNSPTIPDNSGNRIIPELFEPAKPARKAAITPYRKKGKVGRQRKYEEVGKDGVLPVKDVVLYRHKMGRHWPGMSEDMQRWYEFYYFSRPSRAKAKDDKDYERHKRAFERARRWIAEENGEAYAPLGDSTKIVAIRRRAAR